METDATSVRADRVDIHSIIMEGSAVKACLPEHSVVLLRLVHPSHGPEDFFVPLTILDAGNCKKSERKHNSDGSCCELADRTPPVRGRTRRQSSRVPVKPENRASSSLVWFSYRHQ